MKKIYLSISNIDLVNFFIFSYILSYIAGPAIINIYLTLFSLFSIFYFYKNKKTISIIFKDRSFVLLSIFIIYIFLKDIILFNFNSEILSFLRIYLIFSFICFYSILNPKKIELKFIYISIILFILNLDSIYQYISKSNIIGYQIFDQYRLTSFFENEPIIGSFIMKLFFPLLIFFLCKEKKDFFTILILILSIIVIFISGERMPFLQSIFGIIIVILFFHKFTKKIFLFFLSIFFLITSVLIIIPSSFDRYKDTYEGLNSLYKDIKFEKIIEYDINSKNGIYDYYKNFSTAILLWKKNYFLGNGYRYYKNNCNNALNNEYSSGCSTHPHNIYLEILSDYGLIGLSIYVLFIFNLLYVFFKSKPDKRYYGLTLTLIVTSVPFVTSQSIFSSYYGSIYFLYIFLLRYYSFSKKS